LPLDASSARAPFITYDPARASYRPYQRYSDPSQGKGESLHRQAGEGETSHEAIAARLGLPLGPAMVDKGLSGFRGDNLLRGTLGTYLDRLKAGLVPEGDVIGLDEWSRLTRLPLDESSHLLTGLIRAGVGIYVRKTGTLISRAVVNGHAGSMNLAMALIYLEQAHRESETKSRYNRVTIAKRHADAAAKGDIRSKQTPAWLEVTGGTYKDPGEKPREIIVRPGPVSLIKRVWKEARTRGIKSISDGLNRDWEAGVEWCAPFGVVTGRKHGSGGWCPASVSALLHDIRVMGMVQRTVTDPRTGRKRKEGEPYRHPRWPEIISPKEFYEVERIMAERTKGHHPRGRGGKVGIGGRKRHGVPNLLSGLCTCQDCGGPVSFYTARPGKLLPSGRPRRTLLYSYLRCRAAEIGRGCTGKKVAYEPIERAILDGLADLRVDTAAAPPPSEAENEMVRLEKRLDLITRRTEEFAELEDEDERNAMRPKLKAWGKERGEIEARMKELAALLDRQRGETGRGERLDNILALRAKAALGEGEERTALRREIHAALRGVVEMVIVSPRQTNAILRYGLGTIGVLDGKALPPLLADQRLQAVQWGLIAANCPEDLPEYDARRRKLRGG
jgi:hypothetical protein